MKKSLILKSLFLLTVFLFLTGCLPKKPTVEKMQQGTTGEQAETGQAAANLPEGWQTYENKDHKLTLYYPGEWQLRPEIDKEDLLTFFLEFEDDSQEQKIFWDDTKGYPFYSLSVRVKDNPDNITALDWAVRQVIPQAKEEAKEKYESVSFGQYQGVMSSGPTSPAGYHYEYIFCPGNGIAYTFVYTADTFKDTETKFKPTVEQMFNLMETGI